MVIDTLVEDIYEVIKGNGGWDKTITQYLADSVSKIAEDRFKEPQLPRGYLSLSSLGTPCKRKLWYKVNLPGEATPLTAEALGTFFYGDIVEALVISLAKAAGHDVQGEQTPLYINGVKGHRDCVIDGVTIDVKSTSGRGFYKFQAGTLREDDPFGYISQLSSYVAAGKDDPLVKEKTKGAFLAINKERFQLALDVYDFTEEVKNKETEVELIKAMVAGPIPETRLDPVPQSKTSPNTVLCTTCDYCEFKKICWPELRTFIYSDGPKHFVKVNKTPMVPELIE
jgi:hypothetical protein